MTWSRRTQDSGIHWLCALFKTIIISEERSKKTRRETWDQICGEVKGFWYMVISSERPWTKGLAFPLSLHCEAHQLHLLSQTQPLHPSPSLTEFTTSTKHPPKNIFRHQIHDEIFECDRRKHTNAHGHYSKTTVFSTAFHLVQQSSNATCSCEFFNKH